jgi:hypothetical protein
MRTRLHLNQTVPALAAALLLACPAPDILAQATPKETAATVDAATGRSPFDLDIRDGILFWTGARRKDGLPHMPATMHNVADLLRELHPEANFALSPALAEITIGDLKMRTSSVEEKLEAIRIASGGDFNWRNVPSPIDPGTSLQATPMLFILEASPAPARPGLQVEAFNIGSYLNSFSTLSGKGTEEQARERLEQVERMALDMVKEYDALQRSINNPRAKSLRMPSIKFHAGANLAIIIGEPEAVAVAAKVIGALPGAQRSVGSDASPGSYGTPSQKIDEAVKRPRREDTVPAPRR